MKRRFAFAVALAACLFLFSACSNQQTAGSTAASTDAASETAAPEAAAAETTAADDGLVIPLADLTQAVQFFDAASDGTAMQVIALLDDDGTPRIAYNTCQVCAGSPYAYFALAQGYLICQNCGNAFTTAAVGRVSGGCNPMPVSDYEVTGDSVVISGDTLAAVAPLFKNWKAVK